MESIATNWTELGVAMATLAILFFVVKYFCKALSDKDASMNKMVESFSTTINNHIVHEIAQREKETTAINRLNETIEKLIIKIEK